jgi:hypothetical protein
MTIQLPVLRGVVVTEIDTFLINGECFRNCFRDKDITEHRVYRLTCAALLRLASHGGSFWPYGHQGEHKQYVSNCLLYRVSHRLSMLPTLCRSEWTGTSLDRSVVLAYEYRSHLFIDVDSREVT